MDIKCFASLQNLTDFFGNIEVNYVHWSLNHKWVKECFLGKMMFPNNPCFPAFRSLSIQVLYWWAQPMLMKGWFEQHDHSFKFSTKIYCGLTNHKAVLKSIDYRTKDERVEWIKSILHFHTLNYILYWTRTQMSRLKREAKSWTRRVEREPKYWSRTEDWNIPNKTGTWRNMTRTCQTCTCRKWEVIHEKEIRKFIFPLTISKRNKTEKH